MAIFRFEHDVLAFLVGPVVLLRGRCAHACVIRSKM